MFSRGSINKAKIIYSKAILSVVLKGREKVPTPMLLMLFGKWLEYGVRLR